MKKYFPHISSLILTFILILLVVLVAPDFVNAQTTPPTNLETLTKATEGGGWGSLLYLLTPVRWVAGGLGVVAVAILKLASYLTYLSGTVLNYIVQYTVVDMKLHIEEANAVNNAWGVIRDVANMGFIFVLLYAAIQTILGIGSDTKKLIVNIIVVAILINFSLFFTKLVIDASNVLAITFYDAIAPGALSSDASIGLSTSLMQPLGVQSIWKIAKSFEGEQLLTIGIMGTIVSLIAAFIFFAVAIMFVIRFVVLIFVLILSPIAFMAFVLPQLKKHADQWKDALIGQAFFAPIYFLLTWIVIVVARGMPTNTDTWANALTGVAGPNGELLPPPTTSIGIVVNFIIIIVLLITSLIIAKEWSGKAGSGVGKLTSWAMGAAGGATLGVAGRAGRYTLGAGAEAFKESKAYKRLEAASPNSRLARLTLAAADKTRTSSFDIRGSRVGGMLSGAGLEAGQAGGQGGIAAERKAVEEFLERPGTESRKQRLERGRRADTELAIRDNLATVAEHDRLVTLEAVALAGGPALSAADIARLAAIRTTLNPATGKTAVDDFETAINNATTKEIEAIVESNRTLLKSQEFANRISVQQLEAINKSDKFTESEKDDLKTRRFSAVNDGVSALAIPAAARTPAQQVAVDKLRDATRSLADPELEMINSAHLSNPEFVKNMRTAQYDSVQKSPRFTTTQKNGLRTARRAPLLAAIAAGSTAPAAVTAAQLAMKELGPKEIAALTMPDLLNPTMLHSYTQQMLKRMGPDMNPADILPLGTAIVAAGGPAATWVTSIDGRNNGFS